jgi:zinc/manganese transport system ATP-binding protein
VVGLLSPVFSTSNILMELMLDMTQQGQTVLAVLHDSERVTRHFSQVLRLDAATSLQPGKQMRVA